jgi:excisionase family DNA binding protein
MEQKWKDADVVAGFFGIKKPTVRAWTRQGMPHLRCGRLVRYDLLAVQQWLEQRQQGKESEAKSEDQGH